MPRPDLILAALLLLVTPASAQQFFQRDMIRQGPVLQEISTPSALACRAACDLDGQCEAWSWVRPGVESASPICRLQSDAGETRTDTCCISGLSRDGGEPVRMAASTPAPQQRISSAPTRALEGAPAQARTAPRPVPLQPEPVAAPYQAAPQPYVSSAMRRAQSPSNAEAVSLNFDPTARDGESEEPGEENRQESGESEATDADAGPAADETEAPKAIETAPVQPAAIRKAERSSAPLYSVQREYMAPQATAQAATPQEEASEERD